MKVLKVSSMMKGGKHITETVKDTWIECDTSRGTIATYLADRVYAHVQPHVAGKFIAEVEKTTDYTTKGNCKVFPSFEAAKAFVLSLIEEVS